MTQPADVVFRWNVGVLPPDESGNTNIAIDFALGPFVTRVILPPDGASAFAADVRRMVKEATSPLKDFVIAPESDAIAGFLRKDRS
jgi:hypothetical protein